MTYACKRTGVLGKNEILRDVVLSERDTYLQDNREPKVGKRGGNSGLKDSWKLKRRCQEVWIPLHVEYNQDWKMSTASNVKD